MKSLAKEYLERSQWLMPIAEKERKDKELYLYVWDEYLSDKPTKPFRFEIVAYIGGKAVVSKQTNEEYKAVGYKLRLKDTYPNVFMYEDVKYKAKLRLYNYLMRKIADD